MTVVRRRTWIATILLLAVLAAPLASADEVVAFNVETHKYHCLDCVWAIRCTRNCVKVSVSEAKRRGGIPCKVCGGSCE